MHARIWFAIAAQAIARALVPVLFITGSPATAASTYVASTSPAAEATVQGTITIATSEGSDANWIHP